MNRCVSKSIFSGIVMLTAFQVATPVSAQSEVVIASDNFNRPDETPFATFATIPANPNWGRTTAGSFDGVSSLTNNQVNAVSNEGIYYWTGADAGAFQSTKQFARERVVQKDGEVGLVLLGGPDQAIMVGWGPPGGNHTVYIYWYSNGLDRGQLATAPSTLANGDIIEASLENGVISAKVNGVTVASVANTTTLTSGTPGFITYLNPSLPTQVSIFDDWRAGTPGSNTIRGTITENATGLNGVLVTASGGFSGSDTTDGTGDYAITGVPSGATSIVLTPTLSGHTMSPLTRTLLGPISTDVSGEDFTSTLNTSATLTINAVHGSVTKNPDQPTYPFGTNVTLTPVPDGGYDFTSWSGDVPVGHETDNPLQVAMDADRTITANFTAPGVVASDDFNRGNETPLAVGGNWQQPFGGASANLTSNQVAGASNDALYYWQGSGTFDNTAQFSRVTVVQASGQVGLVLLGASGQALVTAWNAGTGFLYIYWYSAGTNRGILTTVSSSLLNGDVIEADLTGGIVHAKINGSVVASVANTTTLTAGRPGFETYQSGTILDNWEGGTPQSFTISGTITENAAGLSGVLVTASGGFGGSATTNGNGLYTIAGVPLNATSIVLTPTLAGHTMSPLTRTVAGPVAANVTGQDFTSTLLTNPTLTINAVNGSVTKNPDQTTYPFGTDVTLTPVPDVGYVFTSWSGDVPAGHATDNPLIVTMNQNRTITANFVVPGASPTDDFNRANETPLAVGGNWQQPFGGGSANLTNNHVAGATGEALYYWQGSGTFDNGGQYSRVTVVQASGQVGLVLLGASNQAIVVAWNSGTLFIYWYSGGSNQGTLTTAASPLQNGDVIEAVLAGGIVYAKINGNVVKSVANTTTLTAGRPGFETFQSGAILDNWEGGTPPSFTISGTITENAAGLSGVLVTASGGFGGSATTNGNGLYTIAGVPLNATSIVLTPTLAGHTMSPLTRTVAGPVAANVPGQDFTSTLLTNPTLTINAVNGSVTKNPDQTTYPFGTDVTLTPVPDVGYVFTSWSGDVPAGHATDNPLIVTMNQNRTITANFVVPGASPSDDFNRANETPLAVGGNWQQPFGGGSANLTSNQVAGAAGEALYYWQGSGTFDNGGQYSRVTVVQASGQVGLVLLGASNQAIVVAWNSGTLFIYWYSGGINRGTLTTAASPLQNGDVIEAVLVGGIVYAKVNGNVVKSVANTTTLTAGRPGFETFQSGAILDNWEGGTPPSFTISGTITENAAGLSGVLVTASGGFGGSATTNGNGLYTIAGVPLNATSIVLTPTLAGHTMSPLTRTVAGPVAANVPGQDFTSTLITNPTLTINAVNGSVTKNPDQPTYPFGTEVTLTPIADPGYHFVTWSGDVPVGHSTDNPLHVTMDQNRTISAHFLPANVVAADYFERANETPLQVGGNWQQPFGGGSANLTGNHVAGATGDAVYYWQGSGTFDNASQFGRLTVVQASGQVGLVLLGASNQAIVLAWNSGTLFIYWYSGGSNQGTLTTAASTLQNGDVIEAVLDGGIVYAKVNGIVVKSVANTTTLTAGRPGFETFQSGAILDNWEAGTPLTGTCAGAPDGTPCDDGNACSQTDTCQAGVCAGANAVVCTASDQCHIAGVCNPGTGACSNPAAANNTPCSDANACTTGDSCQAGVCTSGTPTVCTASDQCHVAGVCDQQTGACSNPAAANNTPCSDANACTTGDTCQAGVCAGGPPANCDDGSACTVDGCTPGSGCTHNPIDCSDLDGCTLDTCSAGVCQHTPTCAENGGGTVPPGGTASTDAEADGATPSDQIETAVTSPTGGSITIQEGPATQPLPAGYDALNLQSVITAPAATVDSPLVIVFRIDASALPSGYVLSFLTMFRNGVAVAECAGSAGQAAPDPCVSSRVVLGDGDAQVTVLTSEASTWNAAFPNCDDGNPCTDDSGSYPACNHTNNTGSCNDGNACTQNDACQAGVCTGSNPVVCTASDQCHVAGVCNPGTGVCSNPAASDNTSCTDGDACTNGDTCQAGTCTAGTATACTASDQCHVAGICNPGTGVCSNPTATNGIACVDGNACTQTDTCQAGVCTGSNPVVCTASDQCHVAGVCNTGTGTCSDPIAANGTTCADGSACTTGDTCQAGTCQSGIATVCTASDQCHVAGICNPGTGVCSNPIATDGTTCNDANVCTTPDTCQSGSCVGIPAPPPDEVQGVLIDRRQPTKLSWTAVTGAIYDIASGAISALRTSGTTAATCLSNDHAGASLNDNRDPASNDGYYYIIRAQGTCGPGSYGSYSTGQPRVPANACP